MCLPTIRVLFMMLFSCVMSGFHQNYPYNVLVARFSVDHALNCPTESYPIVWHNELHDFT